MSEKVTWLGNEFSVHLPNINWKDIAGIYIFCGTNQQDQWDPFYVGQTDSFQNRLPSHKMWDEAVALGATHVHARAVKQQAQRDLLEYQLIRAYLPPLNTQLK